MSVKSDRSGGTAGVDGRPATGEAERAITRLIRQATRPAVGRWLEQVAGAGLERGAYQTLAYLDEAAPVRPTELADMLGIDLSAVSRQVRDLVNAGLVERTPDATDQRACWLRLSASGHELLGRVRKARQEAVGRLLAGWAEEDTRTLTALLGRLADELEMQVGAGRLAGRGVSPAGEAP